MGPAAEQGESGAQSMLAGMYSKGNGVAQDYQTAAKWSERAAEQGNAAYQNEMGRLYEKGIGVPENSKTAAKWYRLAADQGYEKARQNLLRIESAEGNSQDLVGEGKTVSATGSGTGYQEAQEALENEDYFTALEILLPLAEEGSAEAQFILGSMYRKGLGVGKDYKVAAKWYGHAADQGYEEGAKELALLQNKVPDAKLKPEVANDNIALAAEKKKTALSAGVWEGREAYENGDYFTALEQLLPLAEEGAAEAQFILGNMYRKGLGVGKDSSVALQWTTAAAQQGHGDAQYNLGLIYQFGFGLAKDRTQAVTWYKRAAEQGHAGALKNLSRMGVAPDDLAQNSSKKQAVQKEQNTAVLSIPEPRSKPDVIPQRRVEYTAAKKEKINLSANYQKGWDALVLGDYTTAINEWTPLAEQGDAKTQYALSRMYIEGKGVPQDDKTAAGWIKLSAGQGYAEAENQLGIMYEEGRGVQQNLRTAIKYFRRAADKGNPEAQLNLAIAYLNGRGIPKDYKLAAKWYRLAAQQGKAEGQYALGAMYYDGIGLTQDYKEAFRWTKFAAEKEHAIAQKNLGVMYAKGQGVAQDFKATLKWNKLSADQGYVKAQPDYPVSSALIKG